MGIDLTGTRVPGGPPQLERATRTGEGRPWRSS